MSDPHDARPDAGPDAGPGRSDDAVGSAAEEAAKLIGALTDWARAHAPEMSASFAAGVAGMAAHGASAAKDLAGDLEEHLATGAPECTVCPICRAVHVVRAAGPDVGTHLASAGASLLQAAASILAAASAPGTDGAGRGGGVQHIDLDEDAGQAWPEEDDS